MIKAGIRQMRQKLTEYLHRVEHGEEVVITRRDQPIAKMVPIPKKQARPLASRKDLRRLISATGKPLSATVVENREERL